VESGRQNQTAFCHSDPHGRHFHLSQHHGYQTEHGCDGAYAEGTRK
jgi:hypothetical protein